MGRWGKNIGILLGILLGFSSSWGAATAWALNKDCATYLQKQGKQARPFAVVARLQKEPAVLALRPKLMLVGPYMAQSNLLYNHEARQDAWMTIWQIMHEAYSIAHHVQATPLAILAAAGNLKWEALVRWQMFLAYDQVASMLGRAEKAPTLAVLRAHWQEIWPQGITRHPDDDLEDFLMVGLGLKLLSAYLWWHPTKPLEQVLQALRLRQEIKDYLRQVAGPAGLLRPPVVSGLIAQTNHFKNQIRRLRQAVRKQDAPSVQKGLEVLQGKYGLSWLAVMDEANLAPRDQLRLWRQALKAARQSAKKVQHL